MFSFLSCTSASAVEEKEDQDVVLVSFNTIKVPQNTPSVASASPVMETLQSVGNYIENCLYYCATLEKDSTV